MITKKSTPTVRVSYRFSKDVVDILVNINNQEEGMFFDRGHRWLIEYAVRQFYLPMIDPQKENGQS